MHETFDKAKEALENIVSCHKNELVLVLHEQENISPHDLVVADATWYFGRLNSDKVEFVDLEEKEVKDFSDFSSYLQARIPAAKHVTESRDELKLNDGAIKLDYSWLFHLGEPLFSSSVLFVDKEYRSMSCTQESLNLFFGENIPLYFELGGFDFEFFSK